jgi:hypothetical protein
MTMRYDMKKKLRIFHQMRPLNGCNKNVAQPQGADVMVKVNRALVLNCSLRHTYTI